MTAPGQKICRHCVHAVWQMSPSGKTIRRGYHGECSQQAALISKALHMTLWPPIKVMVARQAIWPETNAKTCPGYERKDAAK